MALVVGTVLVTGVGTTLLVHRTSAADAERQLVVVGDTVTSHPRVEALLLRYPGVTVRIGSFGVFTLAALGPGNRLGQSAPAALRGLTVSRSPAAGSPVTGAVGSTAYMVAVPNLSARQRAAVARLLGPDTRAVLVATRPVPPPTEHLGYFLLVALGAVAVAGAATYGLVNRYSRPLRTAVQVTRRLAEGELGARMPVTVHDLPETATLATAINDMGDRLAGAREQQRRFLLSVSHDLRTPLTSIRGYADALAEGATDDVPGAVSVIAGEARRLERLVGDLLDLARLDARRLAVHPGPVDLAEVVRQAVAGARPQAEGSGLTVSDVVAAGPVPVVTDGDRLRQVLANLLENALKFARRTVVVGARHDGTHLTVWVDDDGPGIAPEDLPRVFEPHFTSDRAHRAVPATGLGLAIVAELAAALGGGVRAESPLAPDGGTRMVLWLPADFPPSPPAAPRSSRAGRSSRALQD